MQLLLPLALVDLQLTDRLLPQRVKRERRVAALMLLHAQLQLVLLLLTLLLVALQFTQRRIIGPCQRRARQRHEAAYERP